MKLTGLYQTVEAFGWTSNGICGICGQPQRDMQQNYLLQQIKMIKLCEPIKSMQRSHARGNGRRLATERDKPHTGIHTAAHTLCHTHTHNTRAALAAVAVSCNNCSICSQRVSDRRPKTIPAVATRLLRATHTHTVCHTHTHTHSGQQLVCVACAVSAMQHERLQIAFGLAYLTWKQLVTNLISISMSNTFLLLPHVACNMPRAKRTQNKRATTAQTEQLINFLPTNCWEKVKLVEASLVERDTKSESLESSLVARVSRRVSISWRH